MASNVRLSDISLDGGEVDAELIRWREAIEGAHNWSVGGNVTFSGSAEGYSAFVKGGVVARVCKTGGTAIPAMVGTTPGSGTVTFYDMSGDDLDVTPKVDTAANIAPATVAANTWIVVLRCDGKWLIIYEICPA